MKFFLSAVLMLIFFSCNNPCEDVECKNGGVCLDGNCECSEGYSGDDCGTEVRSVFIGTFNVTETCPNLVTYTVNIAADSNDVFDVDIANFFNSFANPVNAKVTSNLISIPFQAPDNDGRTVQGNGNYVGPDKIIWNYTVSDPGGSIICSNSTWQK